jgi:hypothetical protein
LMIITNRDYLFLRAYSAISPINYAGQRVTINL